MKKIDQLLRDARGMEASDLVDELAMRPGFMERVLLAKDDGSRKIRQVRVVILSGSLMGASLSVAVALVVKQQVHERRVAEAAEVWFSSHDGEGGGE